MYKRILLTSVQLVAFHLEQYGSQYIGASSELPEPTESALISSFERVLLTSIPVQDVVMKLRRIACWERPMETAAYAALYFLLCVFTKVISTIVSDKAFVRWPLPVSLPPTSTTYMTADPVHTTLGFEGPLLSAYDTRSSKQA